MEVPESYIGRKIELLAFEVMQEDTTEIGKRLVSVGELINKFDELTSIILIVANLLEECEIVSLTHLMVLKSFDIFKKYDF